MGTEPLMEFDAICENCGKTQQTSTEKVVHAAADRVIGYLLFVTLCNLVIWLGVLVVLLFYS